MREHPRAAPPLLRVERVVKRFGGATVLNGISLSLAVGESVGLTGPNGCGKTTLLDVISGFLRPERGRVWLWDRQISRWPPYRIIRAGVARTFQVPHLSLRLTVEENLRAAMLHHRLRARDIRDGVDRILELVGLQDLRGREERTLSLGQVRRVEIARALATRPRLVLLDEPFASLSPADAPEVLSVLRRLRRDRMTMLIVAHSPGLFRAVCDRVVAIEDGQATAGDRPAAAPHA